MKVSRGTLDVNIYILNCHRRDCLYNNVGMCKKEGKEANTCYMNGFRFFRRVSYDATNTSGVGYNV